jgi:hypothetical protein
MSWYRVPLWDLWPDIISWRNVAVCNLRSCICGVPSLTRGRVCNLRSNHSVVRVAQNPKPCFTVSSKTPNLEGQVPVLISPRNRVAQLTPGHFVTYRLGSGLHKLKKGIHRQQLRTNYQCPVSNKFVDIIGHNFWCSVDHFFYWHLCVSCYS